MCVYGVFTQFYKQKTEVVIFSETALKGASTIIIIFTYSKFYHDSSTQVGNIWNKLSLIYHKMKE